MNNTPAILKSLIIFAVIVPLSFFVGYTLTNPLDYSTFASVGVLGLVLVFPLLLRWHYPLLLFSLNTNAIMFFMKGRPAFWLVMVALREPRHYFNQCRRGFGEDAFHAMWFLLFRQFRPVSFLEIGVYRGHRGWRRKWTGGNFANCCQPATTGFFKKSPK
jgi:hypothetical protein